MKIGQGVFGAAAGEERDGAGKRRRERMRVLLAARLSTTFDDRPVKIRDISSEGAMIECDAAPAQDTDVVLTRGPVEIFASVIWSDGRQCGLEFETPLDDDAFLILLNPPLPAAPIAPPSGRPSFRVGPLNADDWAAARAWAQPVGRDIFRD